MIKKLISLFCIGALLTITFAGFMPASAGTYTVAPGDSLNSISTKYGTTVHKLMELNQLTTTVLDPGYQLKVPDPNNNLNQTAKKHTVVSGDTLYDIAIKYNTTVQALAAANKLSGTTIHPGQVLTIPGNHTVASRSATNRPIAYTDQELDLLARLIAAEARNESREAQVGVGAVVVNRVLSPKFPSTIKDVIYQPNQFGPARTGKINNAAPQSCITAAKEALNGVDTTNGALFFFDTGTTNSYLRSLPVATQHGNLIFSYDK
ncbi:LysM peptidoglycan-binding domain-containing protein [Peptococcaceae bacterium 1198_IL3148]